MKRRRILVADGDKDVGCSITECLKEDYDVFWVSDGKAILPTISNKKIELLLTDIDIPNIYIYSLLNQIKETSPDLPIIIMYVYCDCTQEMEDTIRKMSDAIFLKPFDMQELKKRIDHLLSEFPVHAAGAPGF
ncbi:MAG: response regulator [Calditrichia bacterium]